MRESNRMLPFREGNHTCPQRHKYSEMVGTHHPVGARVIVAGRFWAVRGGETTSGYGCEHAMIYGRIPGRCGPATPIIETRGAALRRLQYVSVTFVERG